MTMPAKPSFLLAIALVVLAGCATRATAPVVVEDPPPDATSPIAAVQRLHWAFDHGDADVVAGLLTTDFSFGAIVTESNRSTRRQESDRATTLLALRAMFEGVPGESMPASVSLDIEAELTVREDPRPGRSPIHHKIIFTPATLWLEDPRAGARVIVGGLGFVLVRGDAAAIPPDQPPLPSRWWIEQIEEAVPVAVDDRPARPRPGAELPAKAARAMQWGDLLATYSAHAEKASRVGRILQGVR
jgi:hypothetical protein